MPNNNRQRWTQANGERLYFFYFDPIYSHLDHLQWIDSERAWTMAYQDRYHQVLRPEEMEDSSQNDPDITDDPPATAEEQETAVPTEQVVPLFYPTKPIRVTEGAAGYDLVSLNTVALKAHETKAVPTPYKIRMGPRQYGSIREKSSRAMIHPRLLVRAGVIDNDYHGLIHVLMTNLGDDVEIILRGTAIAQLIIQPFATTCDDSFCGSSEVSGMQPRSSDYNMRWQGIRTKNDQQQNNE